MRAPPCSSKPAENANTCPADPALACFQAKHVDSSRAMADAAVASAGLDAGPGGEIDLHCDESDDAGQVRAR
jgi:hypothetical protein